MSPLFCVQSLRVKHGSSLPLDKQLCWVLEPQILSSFTRICTHDNLLRHFQFAMGLASEHSVGSRCLCLQYSKGTSRSLKTQHDDLGGFYAEWDNYGTNDHVFEISLEFGTIK